ncbi:MAG: DUF3857 domain-containing protein [Deltaproteobacteria bacterium]|nr:DUF3857 domain-containing protein [Deltaproteobacteria bacterium]
MIQRKDNASKISILAVLLFLTLFFGSARFTFAQPAPAGDDPTAALTLDADALNLKISKHYTLAADGSYTLHLYVKRRILTYKGKKEYADFKFTYNQDRESVKLLKAETTTAEKQILKVSAAEIHDIAAPWNSEASIYSKCRQLVVSLPAVAPGSEIEIELALTGKIGFWCEEYFRFNDPIIAKEVIIDAPATMLLQVKMPDHLKLEYSEEKLEEHRLRRSWKGSHIPALTAERWTPVLADQGFCLLVSSFNSWRQVADFFKSFFEKASSDPIDNKNPRFRLQPEKRSNADKNPLSHQLFRRMRDLTTYAISLQETDFSIQKPALSRKLGYGTSCDLALLFATELRRQKQTPHILLLNRHNRFLNQYADLPYPGWWDTAVVECNGEFFLFANDKPAPGITGFAGSLALDLTSGKLVQIKDREAAEIITELTLNAGPEPDRPGHLQLTLKGAAATPWRARWRDLSPPEKEIAFAQLLYQINPQAFAASPLTIKNLKDDLEELAFSCDFKIEHLLAGIPGKRAQNLMPLKAPDLPLPYNTLRRNRQQPLAINDNLVIIDRTTIRFPDNFHIREIPQATGGSLPQCQWQISEKLDKEQKSLTFTRKLEFFRGVISGASPDYDNFIKTIRNLHQPEALRVIFAQAAATN